MERAGKGMIAVCCFIMLCGIAYAQVPEVMTWSGQVPQGSAAGDGSYEITFALYAEEMADAPLWSEIQSVQVTGGMFAVNLGAVNPLTIPFDRPYWIGVKIDGIEQREPLTSVGYAFRCREAETIAGTTADTKEAETVSGITPKTVSDNQVLSQHIKEADGTTGQNTNTGSGVKTGHIQNLAVTFAKIANNAVGIAKIANNAVTTAKIADNAVNSSKIADGAVGTTDLADGSVTVQKINPAGSSSGQVLTSTGPGVNWQNATLTLPFNGTTTVSPGFSVTNSAGSIAIRGLATNAAGGTNYGGYFEAYGATGRGVTGATNGAGAYGVYGIATTTGVGTVGESSTGDGVMGKSGGVFKSGVYGFNTIANGYGVFGRNKNNNNYGYLGGTPAGASGYNSTTGWGVYGKSEQGTGITGVNGQTGNYADIGTGSYAVKAIAFTGTGIHAVAGTGGIAADLVGNVRIRSKATGATIIELGEGLDYAEGFHVTDKTKINAGSVLIIDPEHPGKLALSDKPYDTKVAGIAAGANGLGSGVRLGAGEFDIDVAMAGRVYCNVDATYGEVSPGDLLTTSSTPGYAMVVKDHAKAQGAILGKAMEKLSENQKGQILVLVTLQ